MTKKIIFFCTSHKRVDYLNNFSHLKLISCSGKDIGGNWISLHNKDNINHKFLSYADLTAHYLIWKNEIKNLLNEKMLISFSQYRRHWVNNNFIKKDYSFEDLENLILKESEKKWDNYESILTTPFVFKTKFIEKLKNLNFFESEVNIKKQMFQSLGNGAKSIYEKILSELPNDLAIKFDTHISHTNILSAHGMYISTPKILDKFFSISFDWYEKCESIIDPESNLTLVNKPRFFQYLNERFSDFWFKNFTNFSTNPICMVHFEKNKLSLIGKKY